MNVDKRFIRDNFKLLCDFRLYIKTLKFYKKWRKSNQHNFTEPGNIFPFDSVEVGSGTYGLLNVFSFKDNAKLKIGDYCSIGPKVSFVLSGEHKLNTVSSYPFKNYYCDLPESESKGDINIDDDVWIGCNTTILSGVHICQGAVIAAGAVVTTNVPPYAVVGGVPAKILKYRYTPEIINELMNINYKKLKHSEILTHMDDLYAEIHNLDDVKSTTEWMPKKEN